MRQLCAQNGCTDGGFRTSDGFDYAASNADFNPATLNAPQAGPTLIEKVLTLEEYQDALALAKVSRLPFCSALAAAAQLCESASPRAG